MGYNYILARNIYEACRDADSADYMEYEQTTKDLLTMALDALENSEKTEFRTLYNALMTLYE